MTEKTQRKRYICTFDYSVRFMKNHAGLTLTRPTGTTFSHINAAGEGLMLSRVPETL